MNIENVEKARQWLADWPEINFNMGMWFSYVDEHGFDRHGTSIGRIGKDKRNILKHECGTTACFAGVVQANAFPNSMASAVHDACLFLDLDGGRWGFGYEDLFMDVEADKARTLSKLDQIIAAGKWPDEFN